MKRKIYALLMAMLLSTVTLAGCGDSGSSRDRDRYEDDDDDDDRRSSRNKDDDDEDDDDRRSSRDKYDDDDDDRRSSKSSSSKKKDYLSDVDSLIELDEAIEDIYYEDDIEDMIDIMGSAVKKFKPVTSEGKQLKSDAEEMVDILEKMLRYQDDPDRLSDLYEDLIDISAEYNDHLYDFYDAAEDAGVDEDDLYY